jgi:hypothetical protein
VEEEYLLPLGVTKFDQEEGGTEGRVERIWGVRVGRCETRSLTQVKLKPVEKVDVREWVGEEVRPG